MTTVILAGGKGTRLKPFTNAIPKPLVPLGESPILEIILRQLKSAGVGEVVLTVNHLARLIQAFFGDGQEIGLQIRYVHEDEPLGTAGSLRLVEHLPENFLVMNGDVLTTIDYRSLMQFHLAAGNDLTIASFRKIVKIDLGVLIVKDALLQDYIEKPSYDFLVSMGIYACSRKAIDFIAHEERLDMPDFATRLKEAGLRVGIYQGDYEWLDIGRLDDYEAAVEEFQRSRHKYLPE